VELHGCVLILVTQIAPQQQYALRKLFNALRWLGRAAPAEMIFHFDKRSINQCDAG